LVKQSIQYYFLNKKKSYFAGKGEYISFNDIRKVAILFDYNPTKENLVRGFIAKLTEINIFCSVASYSQVESNSILREDLVYFKDSDFNIVGVSRDASLTRFLECEYDVFFDLRDQESVVSDYVHRIIKRKFSVGNNTSIRVNDITFDTANDITSFSNNIIEYLRNLKKV